MIKISNLTKKYRESKALDEVTFEVKKGEILGFLGPNGAGKTTTMKIITGFIAATSGTVTVDDINVQKDSLAIRKKIGYLPENNPLYEDMRVKEYLKFIADLRQVKDDKAITDIIDVCGLKTVIDKNISELSKGFRQRVGLAGAMLHDPEILVLDEPTSGLDPNQIVDIRKLIKKLGEKKTVILSTHILPEVQATCDRVVIINEGKIVASGTLDEIIGKAQGKKEVILTIKGPYHDVKQELSAQDGVINIVKDNAEDMEINTYKVQAEAYADLREPIFDLCVKNKWKLLGLTVNNVSLEDVFRELTTKEQ